MAHRPTFFLSSTIYDFRDLRSAIKFSLEARGCRVLASEFNDFGGNLDQHSYEACLTNIEQADYFVLLIGARVGGLYDKQKRISITQQEYRTAYERHRQGRLRLVTFVRGEVWQLKEDRKELVRFLSDLSISESERAAISAAPSKFANDADFLCPSSPRWAAIWKRAGQSRQAAPSRRAIGFISSATFGISMMCFSRSPSPGLHPRTRPTGRRCRESCSSS